MKKVYITTIICCLFLVGVFRTFAFVINHNSNKKDHLKIGYLYVGDSCDSYTYNFILAQEAIEYEYGDNVTSVPKFNVSEGEEDIYIKQLIEEDCDIIFATSYGYGETLKRYAKDYPDIEFCMATCANANETPVLDNYHNFMGEIYQGRYICGVVSGMKLKELIDNGELSAEDAKVGYVGAFPYAEVISGYTAFFLGIRSIVPEATMDVMYSDSWGDYDKEKKITSKLIDRGCVVISQHSDTTGPAVACEEASIDKKVYHVGYNQSMSDVAPMASIISTKINWKKYMLEAVAAVFEGEKIEDVVEGNVMGNDVSGGFKEEWVKMLKLNDTIAASGTQEKIDELIDMFKDKKIDVYVGDYIGVDPYDSTDTYDLSKGYIENENSSAPTFHYVLKDVINIVE